MREIYAPTSPEITEQERKHAKMAQEFAGECMVLLENDGVLPLEEIGNIALFGSGARHTVKGGTGSGDVNSRTIVTIEQAVKEAGFSVTTEDWLQRYDENLEKAHKEHRAWVEEEAKRQNTLPFAVEFSNPFKEPAAPLVTKEDVAQSDTDTAIYVISRNSGEGADRYNKAGDYMLFPEEEKNIRQLAEAYDNLVVVLNIGGVMDMSVLKDIEGVNAILLMTQLGNIGGYALTDVLLGKVTPSGKLTDTWAEHYSDYPSSEGFSHNDNNIDDEYYTDGIYVGYRYFDTFGVTPAYCFGYGRSYTRFSIDTKAVSIVQGEVKAEVLVKNIGNVYAGKEVVQIYYSAPQQGLQKPYQELAAFAKTKLLAPGEEETLTICFALKDMASYDEADTAWVLEAGDYAIRVGNSSRNTHIVAVLTISERVITEKLKNLFADSEKLDEITPAGKTCYSYTGEQEEWEEAVHLTVDAAELSTENATYQAKRTPYTTDKTKVLTMSDVLSGKCSVEELVSQLSVAELAEFCVGTQRSGMGGDESVIGSASYTVPGAAGDTTSLLAEKRGITNMILADGPAGLRLQPHFKTTPEGEILPGGEMMGDFVSPFDEKYNETNSEDHYQYCTAIPIGWALAQSWNQEMLQEAGSMVGLEMEKFHVDLWLAPALNIHRNPLCGRNFEYYSEDPLISGKVTAAITKGVQSHPGKGTTIKHFAANSQEDNRYFTNSHISERALREIYLKGFEIAVRESQPLSIMTSYNLINGVHTANNYDLLQAAARDEWRFEGVVMTDWFTSQDVPFITGTHKNIYPISASTGCIYAGNDLQMPGCAKNVEDIIEAVTSGEEKDGYTITLADLQFSAANVIRVVAKTKKKDYID